MSSVILLDTGNLYYSCGKRFPGHKIDYTKIVSYVDQKFGNISEKIAYVSDVNYGATCFSKYLESLGFMIVSKKPRRKKVFGKTCFTTCWLVEMTIAAMSFFPIIEHIIIGSSNIDLLPLLKFVKCDVIAAGIPKVFSKYAKSVIELNEDWLCQS